MLVPHEHYLLNMLNFLGEEAKEAARSKSAAKQLENKRREKAINITLPTLEARSSPVNDKFSFRFI